MKSDSLGFNWVDLVVFGLLIVGLVRGRKRGISEELLDIFKWTLILVGCSLTYESAGKFLSQTTMFSLLSCYVGMYGLLALTIALFFAYVRRRVGDKLVTSDAFGSSEYYLGMLAGMYRYICVMLVAMAFLNARYYSPAELQAAVAYDLDVYGSRFIPTLGEVQHTVFDKSFSGKMTQQYLYPVLIKPTAPEDKPLAGDTMFRRREASVNEILDKR